MESECRTLFSSASLASKVESNHLEILGDKKRWTCAFSGCNYRTNKRSNLKMHSVKHETNLEVRKPFHCTFDNCGYRASRKYALDVHLSARHIPGRKRDIQCPMCPSKFYTRATLRDHIRRRVKERSFKCHHCDFKTHDHTNLVHHVKSVHQKLLARLCCSFPSCSYSTNHRNAFKRHRQNHHNDPLVRRPFPCNLPGCAYRAATGYELTKHTRHCHNLNRTRDFECTMCLARFYTRQALTNHIRSVHIRQKFRHFSKASSKRSSIVDADDCKKSIPDILCVKKQDEELKRAVCSFKRKDYTPLLIHSVSHKLPIVVLNRLRLETV